MHCVGESGPACPLLPTILTIQPLMGTFSLIVLSQTRFAESLREYQLDPPAIHLK